ncbi:MAG: hypothetical protein EVA38_00095 [Flavobacteriales bacterium]|nr:MAG: hypothetical protein EVA38_00095 [Flavobacteriales bacterium]
MKFICKFFLILFLFLNFEAFVYAQEDTVVKDTDSLTTNSQLQHALLKDRYVFKVGAYSSNKGIKVLVNGSSENEIIDFSEKANFNDNELTLFLNFNWRFSRKWTLSVDYFAVGNGISKTIDEEIEWNDQLYNGGAGIELGLDLATYRLLFGRTITKGLKHELSVGIGAHVLDLKTYIQGYAYINNDDTGENASTDFQRSSVSVVAPLPNFGAWYFYAPHPKWMITTSVDWFALSIGEYSGGLWGLGAGLNYQFHKNVGVTFNYRYFDFTAKIDKSNWDGKFSLIFQGPLLSINVNI